MKRLIIGFIMILAMAFAFTACGGDGTSGTAGDDTNAKANASGEAAAAAVKPVSAEEQNEALELYACKLMDLYRSVDDIQYEGTYDRYGDKNVALCDLNNDGLQDLCIFELESGEYGSKYLNMYTVKDRELELCNYGFFTPGAGEWSGLQFVYDGVSWGPSFALFIDAQGRPCLQAAQGGATSGEYRMVAWDFDDTLQVDNFYAWNVDAAEGAGSDVKFGDWGVESASMETEDSSVEDPKKCVDGYEAQLQGIQRVILYENKTGDSNFTEELLADADANSMTYEEFLDYVYAQTGKTYEEIVEKSFEIYPID